MEPEDHFVYHDVLYRHNIEHIRFVSFSGKRFAKTNYPPEKPHLPGKWLGYSLESEWGSCRDGRYLVGWDWKEWAVDDDALEAQLEKYITERLNGDVNQLFYECVSPLSKFNLTFNLTIK